MRSLFHPVIDGWLSRRFGAPTQAQASAWPLIAAGQDVLITAPTGSGKTLAAFLACMDGLVRDGIAGTLTDETRVLYVSPLKALSNDIRVNLEEPLVFNQMLDELLIVATRQLTKQCNVNRDFPQAFLQLEQKLRENLSHQWSVEEMAAIAGMGTTLFNERVKNFTGFTPITYLINIRISEAIKLLKNKNTRICTEDGMQQVTDLHTEEWHMVSVVMDLVGTGVQNTMCL